MSRLHVEVCKIDKIEDLENADRMQMATVKGWQCLIGKGQHEVGDLVIFVPPDAVMPYNLIEQLQLDYLKGHGRVKTVKLRGYISQGLILSISVLAPFQGSGFIREGLDVAKDLGITKYILPVKINGNMTPKNIKTKIKNIWRGVFSGKISPIRALKVIFFTIKNHFVEKKKFNTSFDIYTDLDNIKHYPTVFKTGEEVVITEKIHGTNFRAGMLPLNKSIRGRIKQFFTRQSYEFVYGSHRVQKTILGGKGYYGEDVYGQIAKRYKLEEMIPEDYTVYGEIYGPKIQELTYGTTQLEVVFFDVKYKGKYLDWEDFTMFCALRDLPIAPVLFEGKFNSEILSSSTKGDSILLPFLSPKQIREGCVIKPVKESYSNRCGRKILKSISAEYLLTKKKERTIYKMLLKKYLVLLSFVIIFSGCSVFPRLTFDRPNTVPQKTEKSEKQIRCNGEAKYDSAGKVVSCSKGYSLNEKFYNQQERKLTLKENILNFFASLKGWFFWIAIALVIFAPGSIGWIIGTVFNTSRYALESTVRAISRAKKNGSKFMEELDKEHNKDKNIKKTINSVRAKIDK